MKSDTPAAREKQPMKRRTVGRAKGIQLPNEATLVEISRQLKLSTAQVQALRITLQHVHADLALRETDPVHSERSEIVRRLKLVEKALAGLDDACRRHAKHISFFPSDFLATAGAMLTFSAMNDATGRSLTPRYLDAAIEKRAGEGEPVGVDVIETISLAAREAMAIKHGSAIVPAMIARLHRPLKVWVDIDRLNEGAARRTSRASIW